MKKKYFNYTIFIALTFCFLLIVSACNTQSSKEENEAVKNVTTTSIEERDKDELEENNDAKSESSNLENLENNEDKDDNKETEETDEETQNEENNVEMFTSQPFPILYYHAVGDDIFEGAIPELFVSPSMFRKQMQYLKENDYDVITFEDISNLHKYKNPVIITFDDGYENNYTKAYPILKEFDFPAVIFIVNNFLDAGKYLKTEQIKEMSNLIHFESHSVSHSNLTKVDAQTLEKELTEPKKLIRELTGRNSIAFAYPTGFVNPNVADAVKSHYTYAVTNTGGLFDPLGNLYEIKRVYIPRNTSMEQFKTRITHGTLR